jgi:hypothetical protein
LWKSQINVGMVPSLQRVVTVARETQRANHFADGNVPTHLVEMVQRVKPLCFACACAFFGTNLEWGGDEHFFSSSVLAQWVSGLRVLFVRLPSRFNGVGIAKFLAIEQFGLESWCQWTCVLLRWVKSPKCTSRFTMWAWVHWANSPRWRN